MKEPKAPRKPSKPVKPKQFLEPHEASIVLHEGTTLAHILERLGNVDPTKVWFDHEYAEDYGCDNYLRYETAQQPNPKYKQQLKKYEADMMKYNWKLAEYEVNLIAYKQRYRKWLDWKYEEEVRELEA